MFEDANIFTALVRCSKISNEPKKDSKVYQKNLILL